MKTTIDCLPCFLNQAIEIAKIYQLSDKKIILLSEACTTHFFKYKNEIRLGTITPPELSNGIHQLVKEALKSEDPYLTEKKDSNLRASKLIRNIEKEFRLNDNPLKDALYASAAANLMDSGIPGVSDPIEAFHLKLKEKHDPEFFRYIDFYNRLKSATNLFVLGDNAGEIYLDALLLKTIKKEFPKLQISYAVRGGAILNDALISDAIEAKIGDYATLIENGDNTPGTVFSRTSRNFNEKVFSADLILSKGQGNYETLSESKLPIFFLFTAKCDSVSADVGCKKGTVILTSK